MIINKQINQSSFQLLLLHGLFHKRLHNLSLFFLNHFVTHFFPHTLDILLHII